MSNTIVETSELVPEYNGYDDGPSDPDADIVATVKPENKGIEFHVSMRSYTQREMENLIVEAAARMIVGNRSDAAMAKAIEQRCIELTTQRADAHLGKVTIDVLDQPMTPSYGDKKPITMRELIGLTGREYLTATVDSEGKPTTSNGRGARPRMQYLTERAMDVKFKAEIQNATTAAIREVQAAVKAEHDKFLAAEKQRMRDALLKTFA